MSFIDEKGKLFGKVNLVDLVVIISIIVLIISIGFRMFGGNSEVANEFSENKTLRYIVRVESVRDYGMVRVGDVIFDKNTSTEIGVITDIDKKQTEVYLSLDTAEVKLATVENRYDLEITLEVEDGLVTEEGAFANPTFQLLVGTRKAIHSKYSEFAATIIEIL